MTKQEILDELGRRIGDQDPGFLGGQLANAFNFVLHELAEQECLSLLRKTLPFPFNALACTTANGLLNINTQTLLSLPAGSLPERISDDLMVPEWGISGRIRRLSDEDFTANWLSSTPPQTGRPRYWRVYPSLAQIQCWPAPDASNVGATCILEYYAPATMLTATDVITEILPSDINTLLFGVYRHGILYRDSAMSDMSVAEAHWQEGMVRMRERAKRAMFFGRRNQISYREF